MTKKSKREPVILREVLRIHQRLQASNCRRYSERSERHLCRHIARNAGAEMDTTLGYEKYDDENKNISLYSSIR